MEIEIRVIEAIHTHALRHAVLRPHQSRAEAVYAGDGAPTTRHFGAFEGESLVGIASLYGAEPPFAGQHSAGALQLRGMAVAPEKQGRGVGAALVRHALRLASERSAEVMWCNARTSAVPFYQKLGFQTIGDEFLAVGDIPHFVMFHTLGELR